LTKVEKQIYLNILLLKIFFLNSDICYKFGDKCRMMKKIIKKYSTPTTNTMMAKEPAVEY
jgi:hypothetical protein